MSVRYQQIMIHEPTVQTNADAIGDCLDGDHTVAKAKETCEKISIAAAAAIEKKHKIQVNLASAALACVLLRTPRAKTFPADFEQVKRLVKEKLHVKVPELPKYVQTLMLEEAGEKGLDTCSPASSSASCMAKAIPKAEGSKPGSASTPKETGSVAEPPKKKLRKPV